MTGAKTPQGIVHVGAHTGQELEEYRGYAPAIVVWVEADPAVYSTLCQNVEQYRGLTETIYWCLNALVSDTDGGVLDFFLTNGGGQSSSMFEPTDLHKNRFPEARPTGEVLHLKSRSLSALLGDVGLAPSQIDYLVIDTQGAELKCLGGLGRYIENLLYLTVEVSTAEFYKGGAQMHELDNYLEAREFLRVSGRRKHGNALYLRINPQDSAFDHEMTDRDMQHDQEMREALNNMINRINIHAGRENLDIASLDGELLSVYEKYEPILVQPRSRDVCLTGVRLAYENGMERAFSRFLKPLGWP